MRKGQAEVARRRQFRGTGLSWTLVLALVVAAAIVVGVIQNSHGVRLDYLVWHGSVPLIAVPVSYTHLIGRSRSPTRLWTSCAAASRAAPDRSSTSNASRPSAST